MSAAIITIPKPLLALDLVDLVQQRDGRRIVDRVDLGGVFAVGPHERLEQQLIDAVEGVVV
jgi:hypothetical protein